MRATIEPKSATATAEPNSATAAAAPQRRSTLMVSAVVGAIAGAILVRLLRDRDAHHDAGGAMRHWLAGGFPPPMLATLAIWVALSIYWEIAARTASPASTREGGVSRALHLALIGAGQLAVLLPVPGLRARFLPPAPALIAVGLALDVAAVVFMIQARRALGRHWSGAVTAKVGHELIRTGPYRWVRHPIYTGMFALCIGTALVSGELHTLVGFALIVLAYIRKIRMEERNLAALFGPAWQDYCRATKCVVPGLL